MNRNPADAAAATCGCAGLSRAKLLRSAASAAVPGRGLPAIEPGMPTPAGTGLTRRAFVSRAAGLAMAVYGAQALGWEAFDEGIAAAAQGPSKPVLVSVFLEGGMDSLSVLAPTGHARYAQLRPNLALGAGEGTAFSEDPSLRWHPSASPLATLHAEGKVTTFPAIGYTGANQSHFTSRHYWEVGETRPSARLGWMGRYLDRHGVKDNPLQGLTLNWDLSPALAAGSVPVATMSSPDDYDFWSPGVWGPVEDRMLTSIGTFGAGATFDPGLSQARGAADATGRLQAQMAPFQGKVYPEPDAYPNTSFGERLRALAAMLAADLPLRCVAIDATGGYDTHSDQESSLPGNLQSTCDSLMAFQRDLEARGLADRVLIHAWSEFGRRPAENGTGTDHGAGGCSFLIGTKASGHMVGEFPGLAASDLDEDENLRSTSDFRGVYRGLLEQWFGVDAAPIIPGASGFPAPMLLK